MGSWIKNKKIDAVIKNKMLDSFDLHKFSSLFLLKTVQKTGFYKDEDIFSILIKNVTMYEEQKRQIEILEKQVKELQVDAFLKTLGAPKVKLSRNQNKSIIQ